MSDDHDVESNAALKKVTAVSTEAEAALVVQALAGVGIEATALGGHTANFRAEAPGVVKVMVREADHAAAKSLLETIEAEDTPVDWSEVDVGEPES